jgi:hypothetical protein
LDLRRTAAACAASLVLVVAACTDDSTTSTPIPEVAGTEATAAYRQVRGPTVVAVGDMACEPGAARTADSCQQAATARLARRLEPHRVLGLGDQQYESGSLSAFRNSYAKSWGALRSVTRPVPGNHEYRTPGASGYYTYFRRQQPGAPGYYAFDVGSWRVYALNSNCDVIDCARENRWLDRDMRNHPRRCSAVTMHHPRYSSALHGSNTFVKPFWKTALRHRTDLALAGHDHAYERFRRMNATGGPRRSGMVSFVSGAGGKTLYPWRTEAPGSVARFNSRAGVLALRLGKDRYGWQYRTIAGKVVDSGTGRCV